MPGVEGGDGAGPVDSGELVAVDVGVEVVDEPAGEVDAVQPGGVADDQADGGCQAVQAERGGAQLRWQGRVGAVGQRGAVTGRRPGQSSW